MKTQFSMNTSTYFCDNVTPTMVCIYFEANEWRADLLVNLV